VKRETDKIIEQATTVFTEWHKDLERKLRSGSQEADHRHFCRLGPAFRNAAPRDLLARHCVFLTLRTALEREVVPRVRVFLVEQLRMQPAHTLRQSPTTFSPCGSLIPFEPLIIFS